MTVTLHATGGQRLSHMARQLVDLAGGDQTRVRSGRGGMVVDEALAFAYLSTRISTPTPEPAPAAPVPPALAGIVRRVEDRGGLTATPLKPEPAAARKPTRERQRAIGV